MSTRSSLIVVAVALALIAAGIFPAASQDAAPAPSPAPAAAPAPAQTPGTLVVSGQADLASAVDMASAILAYNFECDGGEDKEAGLFWLSTSNPFKFKKRFTGQWYFEKLSQNDFRGDFFVAKMSLPSFTQRPDRGGRPSSADVRVTVRNPQTDASVVYEKVRVGFTREGVELPSYIYVPLDMISEDGRVIIEVSGLGQIAVSPSRLVILKPE